MLSWKRPVGESEVAVVVPLQQIFEPGAKSDEVEISSSYADAPSTVPHEKSGSISSGSVARSVTTGEPAEAFQCTTTERVADGRPLWLSASSGVTLQ